MISAINFRSPGARDVYQVTCCRADKADVLHSHGLMIRLHIGDISDQLN